MRDVQGAGEAQRRIGLHDRRPEPAPLAVPGPLRSVQAGDLRDREGVQHAPPSLPTDRHVFRVELSKLHEYMLQRKARGALRFALHYDGSRAAKIVVEGLDVEIAL